MTQRLPFAVLVCLILLIVPNSAEAYVGPGAGFALASSFFAVFAAMFSAVVMLFTWPIRMLLRRYFANAPPAKCDFGESSFWDSTDSTMD